MITLLTDFGLQDAYVGIMKGIILGIHPAATLIDLSHHIPPQDIQAAGFQLAMAYPYFPAGTIHLVVVDPGVGSQRNAIALDLGDAILVGPNNGVFTAVLKTAQLRAAITLDRPQYWTSHAPSTTFHGRDIFAPVAAHLSKGVALTHVGSPLSPEQIVSHPVDPDRQALTAHIQAIDRFGNLITDIPATEVIASSHWAIAYREQLINGTQTYSDVAPGQVTALVGSHGFIEIAINQGNAQDDFQAQRGESVRLRHSE